MISYSALGRKGQCPRVLFMRFLWARYSAKTCSLLHQCFLMAFLRTGEFCCRWCVFQRSVCLAHDCYKYAHRGYFIMKDYSLVLKFTVSGCHGLHVEGLSCPLTSFLFPVFFLYESKYWASEWLFMSPSSCSAPRTLSDVHSGFPKYLCNSAGRQAVFGHTRKSITLIFRVYLPLS